jgi:lysophospholipase L1-like esterase
VIRIFGDSITAGTPGAAYCDYLKETISFEQYGVGGDTVAGLLRRVEKHKIDTHDLVKLEIGTNDIMLPYLKSRSNSWKRAVQGIETSGRRPAGSKEEFIAGYEKLIAIAKAKRTIVVNIPCIGEDLSSELNAQVDSYNQSLKLLAEKHGCLYADFNVWQKKEIKTGSTPENKYLIGNQPSAMVWDVVLTKYFRMTDRISRSRKLSTTVDGVHLNSRGASGLSKMLIEMINNA